MTLVEGLKSQAWIVILIIALVISVLTFFRMKGKLLFRIGFSLIRAPIFFILFYIPIFKQPRISDIIILPIIGCALLIIGMIMAIVGSKQLMKTNLSGVKGIPEQIITTGLYSIIRHPINLGLMLTFAGWYIIFSGVYSLCFLVIFIIFFALETLWEERNLEKAFGEKYTEYKKRVGMFLPKIKR